MAVRWTYAVIDVAIFCYGTEPYHPSPFTTKQLAQIDKIDAAVFADASGHVVLRVRDLLHTQYDDVVRALIPLPADQSLQLVKRTTISTGVQIHYPENTLFVTDINGDRRAVSRVRFGIQFCAEPM